MSNRASGRKLQRGANTFSKKQQDTLPQRVASVRVAPPPVQNRPFRRSTVLHVPRQKRQKEGVQEFFDWSTFTRRQNAILRTKKIRSKLLRRAVAFSLQTGVTDVSTCSRVVYACIHPRTSRVYIGSTKYDVIRRFKEHVYQRLAVHATALSKFIACQRGNPAEVIQQFFILPLEILPADFPPSRFEEREQDWIRKFPRKRILNVYVVAQSKNRRERHAPYPTGQPCTEPPQNVRGYRLSTLRHLLGLNAQCRLKEMSKMTTLKLQQVKHAAPTGHCIRQIVDDIVRGRSQEVTPQRAKRVFIVPYQTTRAERANIQKILENSRHLFDCGEVRVCSKLNRTVGSVLFNFTTVALETSDCNTCRCEELKTILDPKHFVEGHLLSADAHVARSFLESDAQGKLLEMVLAEGSKFRQSSSPRLAIAAFQKAVEAFDPSAPFSWKEFVVEKYAESITSAYGSAASKFPSARLDSIASLLHKHLVLTPADKNPQKIVFWCKRFYLKQILDHINSPAYERVPLLPKDVYAIHRDDTSDLGFYIPASLPYVYALPKLHKLEQHRAKLRFICGKSRRNQADPTIEEKKPGSTLSNVSAFIAKALNSCIDALVMHDAKQKCRRVWIVRDTQEFIDVLGSLPVTPQTGLTTADFTTMYTQLPHADLCAAISEAMEDVAKVFMQRFACSFDEAMNSIAFLPGKDFPQWKLGQNDGWTLKKITKTCQYIITSSYSLTGGHLRRQSVGIPMGNEASPPLANLYLYVKEKRFVNRMISELGEDEVQKQFHGFKFHLRFIDDIIAPTLPQQLLSAYGLQIVVTGEGKEVVFLGVKTTITPTEVSFRARDKQAAFSFSLVRFPSWHSAVPKHVRVGTVMGMLSRTIQYTTFTKDLLEEATFLLKQFQARAYPIEEIRQAINKFSNRYVHPRYSKEFREKLLQASQILWTTAPGDNVQQIDDVVPSRRRARDDDDARDLPPTRHRGQPPHVSPVSAQQPTSAAAASPHSDPSIKRARTSALLTLAVGDSVTVTFQERGKDVETVEGTVARKFEGGSIFIRSNDDQLLEFPRRKVLLLSIDLNV